MQVEENKKYAQNLILTLKDTHKTILSEKKQVVSYLEETKSNIKRIEFFIDENKSMFLDEHKIELDNQKTEFNRYQSEIFLLNRILDSMRESMSINCIHWLAIS